MSNPSFVVVAQEIRIEGFWFHKGDFLPAAMPGRVVQNLIRTGSVLQSESQFGGGSYRAGESAQRHATK